MTTIIIPDVIESGACKAAADHPPVTHWAQSKCCGELLLILCGRCKSTIASDCNPWQCHRCGRLWDMHAAAFKWSALYRAGKP